MISVLASVLFFLYPILIGNTLQWIVGKYKNFRGSTPWVNNFIIGSLFLYALALVEQYIVTGTFHLRFDTILSFSTFALGVAAFVISLIRLLQKFRHKELKTEIVTIFYALKPYAVSAAITLVAYGLWSYKSPYPLNWDLFEHQTLVNQILSGNFSYIASHISDTFGFDGYSTMFHLLLAVSQQFFQVNIAQYWHGVSIIHLFLTIFASYALTKALTRNTRAAYISAVIGAFAFELVAFSAYAFIPQTFTAVFAVLMISQILEAVREGKVVPWIVTGIYVLFLFLNHYIIGGAAIGILLFTYITSRYKQGIEQYIKSSTLLALAVAFLVLFALFAHTIPLEFLNSGEAQDFTFSAAQKFTFMRYSYGFLLLAFFPLGLFAAFRKKDSLQTLGITVMIGVLGVVVAQLPYAMKFYVLERYFIHAFIALGVWWFIGLIKSRYVRVIALGLFVLTSMALFTAHISIWKSILYYKDTWVHSSPYDLQTAQYLKNTYKNRPVLMISDPATQYVLEAYSGVNSPGGAYAKASTRQSLIQFDESTRSAQMRTALRTIMDPVEPEPTQLVLVLSGRYFEWQKSREEDKQSLSYNIWVPSDLTLDDRIRIQMILQELSESRVVYENPGMVVIELPRQ